MSSSISIWRSLSIAVCTYKRPLLLRSCIESILFQDTQHHFEIIVVDNDAQKSAEWIVEEYKNETHTVKYFCEPKQGLSNARNFAIKNCSFELILFIDDDEYADKNWVDNMIRCLEEHKADVVLGKVNYLIPDSFPAFIKKSKSFTRMSHPNGYPASENQGYCGNTLMRRSVVNSRQGPFSLELNKVGGEDAEFFNHALKLGFKIVFCSDGIIHEVQDEKRLNVKWYFRRGYRNGWLYSRYLVDEKGTNQRLLLFCRSILGGACLSLILLGRTLLNFNAYYLLFVSKSANQLGKVGYFFGKRINEYDGN